MGTNRTSQEATLSPARCSVQRVDGAGSKGLYRIREFQGLRHHAEWPGVRDGLPRGPGGCGRSAAAQDSEGASLVRGFNPSGAVMAAPVIVTGATLEPGAPTVLFLTRVSGGGADGAVISMTSVRTR